MGSNYEGCEGCVYNNGGCFLRYHYPLEASKCPCVNCIVKMTCTHICEALVETYFRGLRRSNDENNL